MKKYAEAWDGFISNEGWDFVYNEGWDGNE